MDESEGTSYVLTEKIYDYRTRPFIYYSRIDTTSEPTFNLLNLAWKKVDVFDFQTSYEHLKMEYEESWKMEEDF